MYNYKKEIFKKLWLLLNSNFFLLLFGFILTTIVGTYLNYSFQKSSWEREKRFKILSYNLDEGTKYIEKLSNLMNRRFLGLQRVLWLLQVGDKKKVQEIWDEYYVSVIEWNHELNANRSRIIRLAGYKLANYFWKPGDEHNIINPISIHGKFRATHIKILNAKKCLTNNCTNLDKNIKEAQNALTNLDMNLDKFINELTKVFLEIDKDRTLL